MDDNIISFKNKIQSLDLTKEEKEIRNIFSDNFFSNPTLKERGNYAFDYFKNIIELHKEENDLDLKRIVDTFKNTRNRIDHGDLKFKLDSQIAIAFYYLRIVILCMQLKRLKINKKSITEITKLVLGKKYNR